jgi:hypothetical protein
VAATDYKGSMDVHVPPRDNPNGLDMIHDPKAKKWQHSTKIETGRPIISMSIVAYGSIWTRDQFHWKGYLLTFPWSLRTSQLNVVCNLCIRFNVNSV